MLPTTAHLLDLTSEMLIEFSENPYIKDELTPLDGAVEAVNALLEEAAENNKKTLLLLSGGSSLDILKGVDASLLSPDITLAPLDERFSTNPLENNMAQISQTDFYTSALENGVHVVDTRVEEGESGEGLCERFNKALLEWFNENPDGKVIATVGVGPDGHLSGIMPHPEDPEGFRRKFDDGDSNHLVVFYDAGDKNPYPLRVTTTLNLLRKIDVSVVYAVGDNKKEAIEKVKSSEGSLAATPARVLREVPGKVFLFTDQN